MKENEHGGKRDNAGRKPKAEELKIVKLGTDAIKEIYGSEKELWEHITTESKGSLQHLKLLCEYVYGRPKESTSITLETPVPTIDMKEWK